MKFAEVQGKSRDELKELALGLKKEMFNLRFQQVTGELANLSRFKQVRRDIARIKTALSMPEDVRAAQRAANPAKKVAAKPAKKATKTKAKKEA